MKQYYLGIDVGKESFTVALVVEGQAHQGHFKNDLAGFERLSRWLKKREGQPVHACMEATNRYWEDLALFLHDQGFEVSVVNPKLIKRHSQSVMQRNKTYRQDALTIADYCRKQRPERCGRSIAPHPLKKVTAGPATAQWRRLCAGISGPS